MIDVAQAHHSGFLEFDETRLCYHSDRISEKSTRHFVFPTLAVVAGIANHLERLRHRGTAKLAQSTILFEAGSVEKKIHWSCEMVFLISQLLLLASNSQG